MGVSSLDRQRRGLLLLMRAAAERQLEERLGHEDRREQVRRETDDQRVGEAANRTGPELNQEQRRDERRDVRIDQRPEDPVESRVDRRTHAVLRLELLLDAL